MTTGFLIAFNGAFISTIGAWSAESLGYKKLYILFRISGIVFIIIGISIMINDS